MASNFSSLDRDINILKMIFCKYKHLISNQKCKVFLELKRVVNSENRNYPLLSLLVIWSYFPLKIPISRLSDTIFTCYLELIPLSATISSALLQRISASIGAKCYKRLRMFEWFASLRVRFYP